ncbi:serine/threonine-protein phosphatase [Streptomyces sp. HNM0574]|nr:serine/threonine-protein phosphatase [Streptomyces sp. HNM0574]
MLLLAAPGLLVLGVLLWEWRVPDEGAHLAPLLAAAPAVGAAATGRSSALLASGACALLALGPLGLTGPYEDVAARAGVCLAILSVLAAAQLGIVRRKRLTRELSRAREVATVTQEALLRPLPPRLEGYSLAAGHLSAVDGALVGGDLYDVVSTPYGVRVIMGDVRGHGLEAVGTVAAVLGSFREAAYDEPRLGGLLRRLERGLVRQQADTGEEFVTVLLLELGPDGLVTAHSCGHPWPYRLSGQERGYARVEPVGEAEPLPPLGLFPLPPRLPEPLRLCPEPGEVLFLYTDGAEDARNTDGDCFALRETLGVLLARRPAPAPAELVDGARSALLRHTGGAVGDDVALLALRDERARVPAQAAAGAEADARGPRPGDDRGPSRKSVSAEAR